MACQAWTVARHWRRFFNMRQGEIGVVFLRAKGNRPDRHIRAKGCSSVSALGWRGMALIGALLCAAQLRRLVKQRFGMVNGAARLAARAAEHARQFVDAPVLIKVC